jgi:hypothetical protein
VSQHQHYIPVREDWLAATQEDILDPGQLIIDPHHHLWDRPGWRYLLDEMLADLAPATTCAPPSSSRPAPCTAPTGRRR